MSEIFLNETDVIYGVLVGMNGFTGGWFATLLLIVLILVAIAFLFRIPLEFTAIFLFPFLLVCMSFNASFLSVGGVFLIYIGILLANHFFFRR